MAITLNDLASGELRKLFDQVAAIELESGAIESAWFSIGEISNSQSLPVTAQAACS